MWQHSYNCSWAINHINKKLTTNISQTYSVDVINSDDEAVQGSETVVFTLVHCRCDRQLYNNPVKKSHGAMCVEYWGWHICGMWCLTKHCCTHWAQCSGVPWDKLHWHTYHAWISLKPPGKKKCPDTLLFSNWLISIFLSPHLILQLSLHLILFDDGCLVCSSLSMNMHPSLKW